MRLEAKKYLFDIQRAAALIAEFTSGLSLEEYQTRPMVRAAVEREFERPDDSELGSGKPAPSRGCPSPMGQHDLGLPLFRCDVFDGCPSCARIVEQQIESAEYLERSREQRVTDRGSLTSVGTTSVFEPLASPSPAVVSRASLRRPASTTAYPSHSRASATCFPIPEPAPVTVATMWRSSYA
jgi:hypothetical protein